MKHHNISLQPNTERSSKTMLLTSDWQEGSLFINTTAWNGFRTGLLKSRSWPAIAQNPREHLENVESWWLPFTDVPIQSYMSLSKSARINGINCPNYRAQSSRYLAENTQLNERFTFLIFNMFGKQFLKTCFLKKEKSI